MHRVALADCAEQPWRNGGGSTRELLAWPSQNDWQLRLSVARIERDGPFSAYPRVQRWFVVLQGAGVRLHLPHGVHTAAPGSNVLAFDGASAPHCTLIDGPTLDLNLMLQGGTGALLAAQPGQAWASPSLLRGVFVFSPAQLHRPGSTLPLPARTLAWCDDSHIEPWTVQAEHDPLQAWWLHFQPGPR
jgi:uncharacterized protein